MLMKRCCTTAAFALLLMTTSALSDSIPVLNPSFEIPDIDPVENPYMAVPIVSSWTELDTDTDPLYGGRNTGTFLNPEPNSIDQDHIVGVTGKQLAFLGSGTGNALLQVLDAVYEVGKRYRLEVDLCPSLRYPPSAEPDNALNLHFLYMETEPNRVTVRTAQVPSTELTLNFLKTFSVTLPTVQPGALWVNQPIGISFQAEGSEGYYWDLDNVRVTAFPKTPELTGDNIINLLDFTRLAAELYTCGSTEADLTGDDCVTMEDFWVLAEHWLDETAAE